MSSNFEGRDQDLCWNATPNCLMALEHIALRRLWLDPQFYGRIRFDAAGYRGIRIEELKLSARVAAKRVRETRALFRFNAMSSRERRIRAPGVKGRTGSTQRERRRRGRAAGGGLPGYLAQRHVWLCASRTAYGSSLKPLEITCPARSNTTSNVNPVRRGRTVRNLLAGGGFWASLVTFSAEKSHIAKSPPRFAALDSGVRATQDTARTTGKPAHRAAFSPGQ